MASAEQWRWVDDEGVQRLLDTDALRAALAAGRLAPQTLVWRRGMARWARAESIPELTKAETHGMHVPVPSDLGPKAPPSPSIPEPRSLDDSTARRGPRSNVVDLVALDARARSKPTLMGIGEVATDAAPSDEDATVAARPSSKPSSRGERAPSSRASSPGARDSQRGGRLAAAASPIVPRAYASLVPVPPKLPTLSDPEETVTRVRDEDATSVVSRGALSKPNGQPSAPPSASPVASTPPVASSPPVASAPPKAPRHSSPPRRSPVATPARPEGPVADPLATALGNALGDAGLGLTGPLPTLVSEGEDGPARERPLTQPFPAFRSDVGAPPSVDELFLGGPAPALASPPLAASMAPPNGRPSATPSVVDEPGVHAVVAGSAPPPPTRRLSVVDRGEAAAPLARAEQPTAGSRPRSIAVLGAVALALVAAAFGLGRGTAGPPSSPSAARARTGWVAVPWFARARTAAAAQRPCLMQAAPSRWAAKASRAVPFELVPFGTSALALGYARSEEEPRGLVLDLDSGKVQKTHDPEGSVERLARVSPLVGDGEVAFVPIADEPEGVTKAVVLRAERPMRVGVQDDMLVLVTSADTEPRPLWKLPGPVSRLQVAPFGVGASAGFGVVYLANDRVFYGAARTDGTVLTEPVALESDAKVGKPMIASDGRDVSVVFADGTPGEVPVRVRWARAAVGAAPASAPVVELPEGGPGGDAIAPDVASLPGGRWLLLWTEGREGDRALRAQTFDGRSRRLGSALRVSPETGNFGQGTVAVVGERAAVAFLLKTDSYQLWGTVLQCR